MLVAGWFWCRQGGGRRKTFRNNKRGSTGEKSSSALEAQGRLGDETSRIPALRRRLCSRVDDDEELVGGARVARGSGAAC